MTSFLPWASILESAVLPYSNIWPLLVQIFHEAGPLLWLP